MEKPGITTVKVRVTEEEYEILRDRAFAFGNGKMAPYIREVCLRDQNDAEIWKLWKKLERAQDGMKFITDQIGDLKNMVSSDNKDAKKAMLELGDKVEELAYQFSALLDFVEMNSMYTLDQELRA